MRPRMKIAVAALAAVAAVAAACGSGPGASPAGIVRRPPPEVGAVELPDASTGTRFVTRAAPGHVLVVYFGYTSCPDVCPTTLADLRFALEDLGGDAPRIEVAMVTVDPGRDDAARLTSYVQSFIAGSHALRTDDPAELRAAADAFGVSYDVETTPEGEIEVAHSAFLYAVDSAGRIVLQWPFGVRSEDLRDDLRYLLKDAT